MESFEYDNIVIQVRMRGIFIRGLYETTFVPYYIIDLVRKMSQHHIKIYTRSENVILTLPHGCEDTDKIMEEIIKNI